MIACGFVIRIFITYNINYTLIFELDEIKKIKDLEMLRIGSFYLLIWCILFLGQIIFVKFLITDNLWSLSLFALLVWSFFFLLPFIPFRCLWYNTRLTIIDDIWNIMIAPFGKLRFMQFFIADIMCSMVRPFLEVPQTTCFFISGYFQNDPSPVCSW